MAESVDTRPSLSLRALQALLVAAGVAAFIILTGLFSTGVRVACLVVIAAVTVLSAPATRGRGAGWWVILTTGAVLSIAGALLAQGLETLGGALAVIGGVLVVIGAAMGFPVEAEDARPSG